MIQIRMPRLSEGMTEGKLLLWNVAVGDRVRKGDQVAEVEADKANMEIEAPADGIVLNLHGKPGDVIKVDALLAELSEQPDSMPAPGQSAGSASSDHQSTAQPEAPTDGESPLQKRQKQFSDQGKTGA